MKVQIIERDGQPEYAVLPWDEYQTLLRSAGLLNEPSAVRAPSSRPPLTKISALREAKGLSIDQLARNVGISPHYLGMIESGERTPDDAILRALAWQLELEGWELAP
ncbi:helix-turn-helix transcriptional regulator [Ectopseudomonas mendocina]|uniref:Helix-turn-helix transcriptional regulator n=1 Tax=Ectopseudomonas mendocina TaxID=300 RepID=A0ABZ2RSV0_ECTME